MHVLKIDQLTKSFGGLTAVDKVSFTINQNEVFGLIGPNGAGKTTVFNLITGIYKVTSGDIEFFGKKIQDKPPFEIAQGGITQRSKTFASLRSCPYLTIFIPRAICMPSIPLLKPFFSARCRKPSLKIPVTPKKSAK